MATQIQTITTEWLDVTAALTLAVSSNYLTQNTGNDIIYISEAASLPAANDKGHILRSSAPGVVLIQATDNFYMRADSRQSEIAVDLSLSG